jgi:hypothetical protein
MTQAFTIRTRRGERCLDVPDGTADETATVLLHACADGPNQLWRLRPSEARSPEAAGLRDTEYLLRNDASGLCLRIEGTEVHQAECDAGRATALGVRGYGSLADPAWGRLQGYGNTFIVTTLDDNGCLTQGQEGSRLEHLPCASVEQDAGKSLRWRFFRAR